MVELKGGKIARQTVSRRPSRDGCDPMRGNAGRPARRAGVAALRALTMSASHSIETNFAASGKSHLRTHALEHAAREDLNTPHKNCSMSDHRALSGIFLRTRASLRRLLEIFQIRRRLILPGGHQIPIPTQVIVFFADDDLAVALVAIYFVPTRTRI